MTFYERLVRDTAAERDEFLTIPLVRRAMQAGAGRTLYQSFLTEAYHHVKHTFPLLALAASRTNDERYRAPLLRHQLAKD
jgi:pyrroloquinoline quinone (PQQ) biosynthesis protein C